MLQVVSLFTELCGFLTRLILLQVVSLFTELCDFLMRVDFVTGGIIIYGALWLFDEDFVHVVSITFTALILTELLMVALTIRTWHWAMVVAEVFSLALYIASLLVLRNYFGK